LRETLGGRLLLMEGKRFVVIVMEIVSFTLVFPVRAYLDRKILIGKLNLMISLIRQIAKPHSD
jgi:hypothetical protein